MGAEQVRAGFLTGSRRYGAPRPDSDIDLVVLVDQKAFELLTEKGTEPGQRAYYGPIRFGELNLIAVTDPAEFDAWQKATDELEKHAPVDRETAKRYIKEGIKGW